jgi:di/tricarboxylate transporter
MSWEAWVTCALVVVTIVALARDVASADALLLACAAALGLLRLTSDRFIDPRDLAGAFGNEGLITVAVLFVLAAALTHSGGTSRIGTPLLGKPKTIAEAQARMMLPVAGISAFLNNTAVVAMFLPVVKDWARNHRMDVSKLLMPLSFAAVLGGICSLIGTSTNIVVQGLMLDAGMEGMGMFTITPIGLPIAIIGFIYVMIASRYLLPTRVAVADKLADAREYSVELEVAVGSPLDGESIEKAGLRQLPGLYLVEVRRGEDLEVAVAPGFVLRGGDRLVFVGLVQSVADLVNLRGLVPVVDPDGLELDVPRHDRAFIEAVVSATAPTVGQTIRDGRFRGRYGAAVLAVHRNGELLKRKIGDIMLRAGDTLLLEAHPSFVEQQRDRRDFFLVSTVAGVQPIRHDRAWVSLAILAGVVIGGTLTELFLDVSMLPVALAGAGLAIATGCCSMDQARKSIEWSVLFAIGAALVIAKTLQETGAADALAGLIAQIAEPMGTLGALAVVYLGALILTELLTNNAAAALAFPIAHATATALGVSPMPFVIAVCVAASCGFATPTGYQTHLMVYGAGGYRFGDFLRMGLGLDLLCFGVAVVLIPFVFPF